MISAKQAKQISLRAQNKIIKEANQKLKSLVIPEFIVSHIIDCCEKGKTEAIFPPTMIISTQVKQSLEKVWHFKVESFDAFGTTVSWKHVNNK